jgi:hypothetical protein
MNPWTVRVFLKALFSSQQQSPERTQSSIPTTNTINRMYWNQNVWCISPLIKQVILVCISSIIPMTRGCVICVNVLHITHNNIKVKVK